MKCKIQISKKQFILLHFIFIALAVLGLIFVNYKAWNPALPSTCFMKTAFHLYCPGCGVTRSVYVLIRGHFLEACLFNPIVPYMCVWCGYYYIRLWISIIKNKTHCSFTMNTISIWFAIFMVIIFFVVRNILLVTATCDFIGDLSKYYPFN